jgi:dTDP-glucose pyrophosphorylase
MPPGFVRNVGRRPLQGGSVISAIDSSSRRIDKIVILAAGLGTRMRKADASTLLAGAQAAVADTGVKALMPIKRPFLDYVLQNVADAGFTSVCLVIGAAHEAMRKYYGHDLQPRRIRISFAVQHEPKGTADAVAAAESFVGADEFAVINSDKYYPLESLRALRELDGPGAAVFERDAMLAGSNIPADRISKFAVVQADERGYLRAVLEKPDDQTLANLAPPICLSMNCWRFDPAIILACRKIKPSARNELELPDAVEYSIQHLEQRYRLVTVRAPVLDLSSRSDVAAVTEQLAPIEVSW